MILPKFPVLPAPPVEIWLLLPPPLGFSILLHPLHAFGVVPAKFGATMCVCMLFFLVFSVCVWGGAEAIIIY